MTIAFTHSVIILRRLPYGESDLVVTFFSEELGRLTGFAKGAKNSQKRFGSGLEPGSIVTLSFTQKPQQDTVFLQEAKVQVPSPALKSDLSKHAMMWVALEWALLFLQEAQADQGKFDYLSHFLQELQTENPNLEKLVQFQEDWLSMSGYAAQDAHFLKSLHNLKQSKIGEQLSWREAAFEFFRLAEALTGKNCKSQVCLADIPN